MAPTPTDSMDLVNILSQAADLSNNSSLDFDAVAYRCDQTLSQSSAILDSSAMLGKRVTVKKAGKTQVKKRTWKKPKDKPKRPLSAYNLFFQHEREKIVMATAAAEGVDPEETLKNMRDAAAKGIRRRQRRNCKSHGKIGFAALAKNIAEKWKALDDDAKSPFEARALKEKKRYKAEIEKWNEKQKSKQQIVETATMDAEKKKDPEKNKKASPNKNVTPSLKRSLPVTHTLHKKEHKSQLTAIPPREGLFDILDRSNMKTANKCIPPPNNMHANFSGNQFTPFQPQQQQPLSTDGLMNILDQAVNVSYDPEPIHSASLPSSSILPPRDGLCSQRSTSAPESTSQCMDAFDTALDEIFQNSMFSKALPQQEESNSYSKSWLSGSSLFHPIPVFSNSNSHSLKSTMPRGLLSSLENLDNDDLDLVGLLASCDG